MRPVRYFIFLFIALTFISGEMQGASFRTEGSSPVKLALNTSTISGYNLTLPEMISLTAKAGFDGIELWVQDVEEYVKEGGTLEQLASLIRDTGLSVENMIGFAPCLSEDSSIRKEGVAQLHRELEMAKTLQSKHMAITGAGLQNPFTWDNLDMYARQYKEILEICEPTGVKPLLELWGAHHLSKVAYVSAIVIQTGRTDGALLLDLYHLYRGGNPWQSLALIDSSALPVIHINDYPGNVPYDTLNDADRVMPGAGICPFKEVIKLLEEKKYQGVLSVELFNESYWSAYEPAALLEKIIALLKQEL